MARDYRRAIKHLLIWWLVAAPGHTTMAIRPCPPTGKQLDVLRKVAKYTDKKSILAHTATVS